MIEKMAPDLRIRGALGGTRTPNLLIRRNLRAVSPPAQTPADLPEQGSALCVVEHRYAPS
jgi:hypothetical protein